MLRILIDHHSDFVRLISGRETLAFHACAHDAAGFCLRVLQKGPGYAYREQVSPADQALLAGFLQEVEAWSASFINRIGLDPSLTGQLGGLCFWDFVLHHVEARV